MGDSALRSAVFLLALLVDIVTKQDCSKSAELLREALDREQAKAKDLTQVYKLVGVTISHTGQLGLYEK